MIGTIDGVSVDESLLNPEYAYEMQDSSGTTVGFMYAITKNNANLSDIEAFTFDFQPVPGETYTIVGIDEIPATPYSNLFVCFASGTLIETETGPVPVEDIRPGQNVLTRDNGMQPVLWTGSRHLTYLELVLNEKIRPILIEAGALGQDNPAQPLMVSPQHRVLVGSKIVERMVGQQELLVPAKKLLGLAGVEQFVPDDGVTYHHLLCERHEIIRAGGSLAETLFLGKESKSMLTPIQLDEIADRFPELMEEMELHHLAQAAKDNRHMIDKLVERHAANSKSIAAYPWGEAAVVSVGLSR